MGGNASWFVAIVIAVCCLATNIGLSSVFTDFVHEEILKNRGNRKAMLILTGIITFCVSLLGFDEICKILGFILKAIYPVLIIFVIARMTYFFAKKMHKA